MSSMHRTHAIDTCACTELLSGQLQKLCLHLGNPLPNGSNPLPHLWRSNRRTSINHVASIDRLSDRSMKVVGIKGLTQPTHGIQKYQDILRSQGASGAFVERDWDECLMLLESLASLFAGRVNIYDQKTRLPVAKSSTGFVWINMTTSEASEAAIMVLIYVLTWCWCFVTFGICQPSSHCQDTQKAEHKRLNQNQLTGCALFVAVVSNSWAMSEQMPAPSNAQNPQFQPIAYQLPNKLHWSLINKVRRHAAIELQLTQRYVRRTEERQTMPKWQNNIKIHKVVPMSALSAGHSFARQDSKPALNP